MIERNKLTYKPITVGCERLPQDTENRLLSAYLLGIKVYTDSEEIYRCLRLSGANCGVGTPELQTSLYYITRELLPFRKRNGLDLQTMEVDCPGDVYVSPQLDRFYFNGIEKLGTVASMIHGIRSFVSIQKGIIGLHSALIYDKESKQAHLLVGKDRVGKSSIGQALEEISDRFMMISDDWNEVDILSSDMKVEPVSTVFSPPHPNENYELAFVSFDKPYYWKHNVRPLPGLGVGKIIEVYGNEQELDSDDFLFKSLSHIPFLCQPVDEELFVCPYFNDSKLAYEIQRRRAAIVEGYNYLKTKRPTWLLVNDPNKNTVIEAATEVLDILR